MRKSEELQNRIEQLRTEIATLMLDRRGERHTAVDIASRHAEILVIASQLADISSGRLERQTETLIRLTWGLFWLTLALTFVAAVQIYVVLQQN